MGAFPASCWVESICCACYFGRNEEEGGGITGDNALAFDHTESAKVPALSRFIEMSAEHRRRLFAGLIGDRVLKRIEAVVDNDWQCDWALDLDAFR